MSIYDFIHIFTGIATLLNKMNRPEVTIGVDGSLYRFHPHFHDLMEEKIRQLVKPGIKVSICKYCYSLTLGVEAILHSPYQSVRLSTFVQHFFDTHYSGTTNRMTSYLISSLIE